MRYRYALHIPIKQYTTRAAATVPLDRVCKGIIHKSYVHNSQITKLQLFTYMQSKYNIAVDALYVCKFCDGTIVIMQHRTTCILEDFRRFYVYKWRTRNYGEENFSPDPTHQPETTTEKTPLLELILKPTEPQTF